MKKYVTTHQFGIMFNENMQHEQCANVRPSMPVRTFITYR